MDEHKYEDIINLPHYKSKKHPKMSNFDRAAQFSPFAALTGHSETITETARFTESKKHLTDEQKDDISEKLKYIEEILDLCASIIITYYVPDEKKNGGAYICKVCSIKRINEVERTVLLNDGTSIFIDDIAAIDGDVFDNLSDGFRYEL